MSLWTPAQITTALWLDAADSSTLFDAASGGSLVAADGTVARWEDKSGNARHVTQATAGSRPQRKTTALNSVDTVRFNGTSSVLQTANFTVAQPYWIWTAFSLLSNANLDADLIGSTSPLVLARPRWTPGSALMFAGAVNLTQTTILSGSHVWGVNFSGATSSTRFNGTASAQSNAGTNAIGNIRLGRRADGFDFLHVDFGEAIITGAIDLATRELIEGYLAHKWGIAGNLPNDHPHKSSAPTNLTQSRRRRDLGGFGL